MSSFLVLVVIGLCPSIRTYASPTPGDTDLVRDRQDRLLEEQRRRPEELKDLPGKAAALVAPTAPVGTRCFPIKTIGFKGADSLFEGERERLLKPCIGQCLDVPQLNERLKVTSRAYLPQQNVSRDNLKVLVVEGKLEGLKGAEGLTPIVNGLLAQYASDQLVASDLSEEGRQKKIATAQIIGLISASLAGGDATTGSMIGGYGEKYNLQLHEQQIKDALAAAFKKLFTTTKGGNPEGDIAGQDPTNQSDVKRLGYSVAKLQIQLLLLRKAFQPR